MSTKPKKDTLREAVTQIMYCCSGDKEQYEETVNAVLSAVEAYVTQLTKTALQNVPHNASQPKITQDSIVSALVGDPRKQSYIQSLLDKKDKKKEQNR